MPGIGQSNPNPLPVHGQLWIDARNYGVSPSNGNNTPALQAAVDAALARAASLFNGGNNPQVTVFIPAGSYQFQAPVWIDGNFVEVRGEGVNTQLSLARGCSYPLFLIGIPRTKGGTVPNAAYRPDIFGKLDATAASAAGQRWGIRTNTDLQLVSPASHFAQGGTSSYGNTTTDAWAETKQLTVEFAVEGFTSGQIPGACYLMGVGSEGTGQAPAPFHIVCGGPNQYTVYIGTQSSKFAPPVTSVYQFTSAATGVQKITLQINLVDGTFSAAVNGVQVAVTGSGLVAGTTLNENFFDQFVVNSAGTLPGGPKADFALYGCCFSRSIRYTTPGVGATMARVDHGAITDRYRYFPSLADDPNAVGYLGLSESPSGAPRMLTVVGGGAACPVTNSAAFLLNGSTFSGGAASNVKLIDMQINADINYGSAVAMGLVLETHFKGLVAYGGTYSISNIPIAANYKIYVDDCVFRGYEAGYFGFMSTIIANNTVFTSNGKSCWRLVGCDLRANDVTVPGAGNPQYDFCESFASGYGGFTYFRNVVADNEGDIFLRCGIYAEREGAGATSLHVEGMNLGSMGLVPFFRLSDLGSGWPAGTAILDVDTCYGGFTGAMVETNGPGWAGTVRNMAGDHAQHISNIGASPGRVVVEDIAHVAPPHYGAWYRNGSRLVVPGAADGQFREIGVVASGTIGTPTPPQFIGRRPEQATPNASLALYATDHTAIAATVSGQGSSWGNLTDAGAVALASQLFSTTLRGTPISYRIGLSTVTALRSGGIAEPDPSTGYSSAVVANSSATFTAAAAGSKASATAISFGTATKAYTVQSIYIADATGAVLVTIQLASPLNVTVGMTPTIASGALTFTHTPLPGFQFGCLTDYAWGKLWDYFFRGAAYTPPAQFYGALTTAPTGKATTSLTEPSGNGYARVASGANWFTYSTQQQPITQQYGDVTNAAALAFPTPTGSWGTITGGALADSSSAGNVWAVGPLTVPASPAAGTPAPTFAVGAFLVAPC
jgi:hypothetical protein